MGDQAQRNELSIQKPWRGENRFLERVFKNDEFQKAYRARLKEINETIGRPERITQLVDQLAAAIRPAVKEESGDRLARFDKAVAGESYEPMGFGGGPPGMSMGVQPIKKFAMERTKSVAAQLAGKSNGAEYGSGHIHGAGIRGEIGQRQEREPHAGRVYQRLQEMVHGLGYGRFRRAR
jgi:hypothetical protein